MNLHYYQGASPMKKAAVIVVFSFVLSLILPLGIYAYEVKTKIVRVSETRAKSTVKKKNNLGDFMNMQLTLQLKGSEVEKVTKYGKIKIDKAVDNLGNSLVNSKRFFGGNRLKQLNRNRFSFGNQKSPKDEAEIFLNLKAGKRMATTIAVLEGSLSLGIATTEEITLKADELEKLVGKKIQNATLKKLGAEILVKVFKKTGGNILTLDVSGKPGTVNEVKFRKVGGESINVGQSSFGFGKKRTIQIFSSKPLPKNAKLVIPVETSLKEIVVKFRFTNIPLP